MAQAQLIEEIIMPWERFGDGLRLVGAAHFDPHVVERAIDRLSLARNRPATMCSLLRNSLANRRFSKDTIWRFSKWCDWADTSVEDARQIAVLLFGEVPPRLRDEQNKPVEDAITKYLDFLNSVVARYGETTTRRP
jgi:hypothetical protein